MLIFRRLTILIICLLGITGYTAFSQETIAPDTTDALEAKLEKGFNPGEFIFEHVGDAYSWHILTLKTKHGDHPVAIPLPVIVYSKTTGLHAFWSSRLEHGNATFQNFKLAMEGPNKGKVVEIQPDGTEVKPLDFSMTKTVTAILISVVLMLWIFLTVARAYKNNPNKAPKGIQSVIEPFILFIRDDIARPSIGEKRYEQYMPFLCTVFFFIWINNMLGLIPIFPGGANVTGNIAVTMVMAVFTFVITTFSGNKHYWVEMVNTPGVPWWLKFPLPIMPLVEISGMFTKPFILMIRLFANILAGHIVMLGFFSLIFIFGQMNVALGYGVSPLSVAFVIFIYFLELLVALIQAYVFTLLSALYFGLATTEHH